MKRFRSGLAVLLTMVGLVAALAPRALATAEVHHLSLVLSGIPTGVDARDYNDFLEDFNKSYLGPREGVSKIQFGWLFDAELRYFMRPNLAVDFGVGQLKPQTRREFLPALQQDIQIRGELLTVPVHLGGAYYLAPYNQGDFQARVYLGAGFMSQVYNRAMLEVVQINTDSSTTLPVPFRRAAVTRDSPGFYLETGVHMFFASRFSVMLGGVFRSAQVRDMVDTETGRPVVLPDGRPFKLDTSGLGFRMGIAIGL